MNKKILIILILLIVSLSVSGCAENDSMIIEIVSQIPNTTLISEDEFGGNVYRIHDDELNVTCYVFDKYKGGGISCIPDSQIYGK